MRYLETKLSTALNKLLQVYSSAGKASLSERGGLMYFWLNELSLRSRKNTYVPFNKQQIVCRSQCFHLRRLDYQRHAATQASSAASQGETSERCTNEQTRCHTRDNCWSVVALLAGTSLTSVRAYRTVDQASIYKERSNWIRHTEQSIVQSIACRIWTQFPACNFTWFVSTCAYPVMTGNSVRGAQRAEIKLTWSATILSLYLALDLFYFLGNRARGTRMVTEKL